MRALTSWRSAVLLLTPAHEQRDDGVRPCRERDVLATRLERAEGRLVEPREARFVDLSSRAPAAVHLVVRAVDAAQHDPSRLARRHRGAERQSVAFQLETAG